MSSNYVPATPYNREVKVVIAGGGIIGLTLAWRLSQQHVSVTVLEAATAGGEASWAGAGMLAPGGEIKRDHEWARFTLTSARLYRDFAAELKAESGIDPEWRLSGAVDLAASEEEWRAQCALAAKQSALGIDSEPLSSVALRELVPALGPGDWQARWYPADALVNPRATVQALLAACRRRGVAIEENTRVVSVREGLVATHQQPYRADAVVIASGAWSSSIQAPVPLPPAVPVRGHLIGYQSSPGWLAPILRHQHTYLLQRASGLLIAGTSEEHAGFDRAIDPALARDIAVRAAHLLPALAAQKYETWIGFRPGSEAGHPLLGQAAPGLWLAYGHYRNGILLAPATAARLTREMLSARPDLRPSTSAA